MLFDPERVALRRCGATLSGSDSFIVADRGRRVVLAHLRFARTRLPPAIIGIPFGDNRALRQSSVYRGHLAQTRGEVVRESAVAEAPGPVAFGAGGRVHARVRREAEHVLQLR